MVGLTDTQYSSSATTCPWPACPPPSPARMIMAIMMRIMRMRMITTSLPTTRPGQEAASTKTDAKADIELTQAESGRHSCSGRRSSRTTAVAKLQLNQSKA